MKLALGYRLDELTNSVTGSTPAFYEPALDYLAVKIPRWDLSKLKASDNAIGSEMKSVGEVMALGRSFPEALQKAVRMLNIGADGLSFHKYSFKDPKKEIVAPTDTRLFAIYDCLRSGLSTEQISQQTKIDKWFIYQLDRIAKLERKLKNPKLYQVRLRQAKQLGLAQDRK